MLKYIKWELKSLLKGYKKLLIIIGIILGLMAIIPLESENFITEIVVYAFIILLIVLLFGSFLFGTKKVVDTFRKPTFMLESMISFPPHKILLAKYILAIILNSICVILLSISLSVFIYRATSIPILLEVVDLIFDISNLSDIVRVLISLIVYSTSFTSLVTFSYILSKSLFPKGKGSLLFGIVVWYILTMVTEEIFALLAVNQITGDLLYLVFIAIFYFGTVKLIENKLEIYN